MHTETILGRMWWLKGRSSAGPRSFERHGAELPRTLIATKETDLFGSFGDTVKGMAQNRLDKIKSGEKGA